MLRKTVRLRRRLAWLIHLSFLNRNNEQMTNSYNQNGGSGYAELSLKGTVGLVADLGGYTGGANRQTFCLVHD
jgi:hypothetical protein